MDLADLRARRQPCQNGIGEFRQREGISQQTDARTTPNPREGKLRRQRPGLPILPRDRQRQQPLRNATLRFGLDLRQQQLQLGVRQRCNRCQPRRLQRLVLQREPTTLGEIGWQDVMFQHRTIAQQSIGQAGSQNDRLIFGHGFRCGRMGRRPARLLISQMKPIETVRRQREQIGQLTDRWECRATIQFDRCAARELRQLEFHRLRRPRHVGDA